MKILALDWGSKRIGAALADTALPVPLPRDFFFNDSGLLLRLQDFCQTEKIDRILLGLPRKLDGSCADSVDKVARFAQDLKRATGLPLELLDERFTSTIANRELDQSGLARQKTASHRKNEVDSLAAQALLETWLQRHTKKEGKV